MPKTNSNSSTNFVVHRGNSPVNRPTPIQQVEYYVGQGFKTIEVDIYVTTENTFKFCHPLDAQRINEVNHVDDSFITDFATRFPGIKWLVDLKCLDLDRAPERLMDQLIAALGRNAVFISAQDDILEYAHTAGSATGQYFRSEEAPGLTYQPDYYLYPSTEQRDVPLDRTILFCGSLFEAQQLQSEQYAGLMLDGNLLI